MSSDIKQCEICSDTSCDMCTDSKESGLWVIDPLSYDIEPVESYDQKLTVEGKLSGKAIRAIRGIRAYATYEDAESARRLDLQKHISTLHEVTARLERIVNPDSATTMEKIKHYEGLLHDIQFHACVTLNENAVSKLIKNICAWSYANRAGNGELTEEEIQKRVDYAFRKLRE